MKGDVTQISLAVEKIRLLGHTSGWDTLAGLVTVINKITIISISAPIIHW